MKALVKVVVLSALLGCVAAPKAVLANNNRPFICEDFKAKDMDENTRLQKKIELVGDSFKASQDIWEAINRHYQGDEARKLIIFMDGTANSDKDLTNVRKLYRLALEHACNGHRVIPYYDKGVGAEYGKVFSGGMLGAGANKNIRQAYRFLVEAYKPNDEIYLIGFSRGAFTVRSLNGLIEYAGLLNRTYREMSLEDINIGIDRIWGAYKKRHDGTSLFEETLKKEIKKVTGELRNEMNIDTYSLKPNMVRAIGVFDTVPAIGALGGLDEEPDDHRLDLYAESGFHAISLDEQRDQFRLLRFKDYHLENRKLEEVWFAGVHADIGGGYTQTFSCKSICESSFPSERMDNCGVKYRNGLETITLNWMIYKFKDFKVFPEFLDAKGKEKEEAYSQCVAGKLNDEYFDGKKWGIPIGWYYKMRGLYQRNLRTNDKIHNSVRARMREELDITRRQKGREPDGKYRFRGIIDDDSTIIPSFTWVNNSGPIVRGAD